MARPVLAEPYHGRDWAVDPARHPRDANLSEGDRRRADRPRPGRRGVQAPTEGGLSDGVRADGADGADLHLHRLHFPLWHSGRSPVARLPAGGFADRVGVLVLYGSVLRLALGPARPQARLHLRRGGHGALRIFLVRDDRFREPGLILLAVLISTVFHDLMWGPLAALTAECFTPRLRYSGATIGFQLAAVFAGGP